MILRIFKYLTTSLLFTLVILAILIFLKFVCSKNLEPKELGIPFSIISSSIGILFVSLTYFNNRESTERTQIEKYYSYLNDDIGDALYGEKKGVDAYLAYVMSKNTPNNVILDNLNLVLSSFETYLTLIENNKFISESYKRFGKTRLHLLFYSKVLWPLHETICQNGEEFILRKHDDSKLTLPKFAEMGINSIQYLIDNKIAQDSEFKLEIMNKFNKLIIIEKNIPKSKDEE